MDAAVYSNWGRGLQEGPKASRGKSKTPRRHVWGPGIQHYADPGSHQQPISATPGPWGHCGPWGHIFLIVSLVLGVIAVLWVLFLSIFFAKAQSAQAQLQMVSMELQETQEKLLDQLKAIRNLSELVSCSQCPASWIPFQGSCYFFSQQRAQWDQAQRLCADAEAHLVIVKDLEEQTFLTRNTRGLGYWLGLKAVRERGKIQHYQWVDGVSLSFSNWNRGEPNDSRGKEDCVMMLHTGMWNDAPCDNERDNWVCEKRRSC